MKNMKENLKKAILAVMITMMALNSGLCRTYAEEETVLEPATEETVEMPVAPETENMSTDEANKLVEEYNLQVDEYNESLMEEYQLEVEEVEKHNAEEDAKVAQNEKDLAAYEAVQAKVEADSKKGIIETRTTDAEDLPTDYEVTVEADKAKTIKVTEAAEKSGKTVKVINLHIFYNEDCPYTGYTPADMEQFVENEEIHDYLALAEWETIEVDENDTVQVISESEAMGYSSSAFYKRFEGYTNGCWMPAGNVFSSTAVNSEWAWYRGASQIASYDMGTTDGRAPVDMFSLNLYSFYRYGAEPTAVEKYTADYKEAPVEPELLEKMDLLEEKAVEEVTVKNDEPKNEIVPVEKPSSSDPVRKEPVKENAQTTVEIKEEAVPQAEVTETVEIAIPETVAPQAAPEAVVENNSWALVNLICALVSALAALGMVFTMNRKEEDDENEENEEERKANFSKILGIIPAALAILFFLLTEDMNNPMVLTDRYTLMMILFPLVSLLTAWLTRNEKEDDENKESELVESPAI